MGGFDSSCMQSGSVVLVKEYDGQMTRTELKRIILPLFIVTLFLAMALILPAPVLAWDPTSHDAISEEALNSISGDSSIPVEIKNRLFEGIGNEEVADEIGGDSISDLIVYWSYGKEGEAIHGFTTIDGELATGSNGGNDYPDYLWQLTVKDYREWQRTGNNNYRIQAYEHLGQLVHAIEDEGCPPHAWYVKHGGIYFDNMEALSLITSYDTTYYKQPTDIITDGKNVVDVGDHEDRGYFEFALSPNVYEWTDTGLTTSLQTPGATRVRIAYAVADLFGMPDEVFFRVTYDTTHGEVTNVYGPFSPRYSRDWFEIEDDFAPNGRLSIEYQRREDGYSRTGQLAVYVMNARDIADGQLKPSFDDPWEYYYWQKNCTLENTAASYWRRYWSLGRYGDLSYDILWVGAPNTERSLLTQQWASSQQTIQLFLADAQKKLDDPGYSVEEARGDGIRVVTYQDSNYNSGSPEYLYSQAIVYEPDLFADGLPILDSNFYYVPENGGWSSIESSNLGFMANLISSIDIRGDQALKVTLYSGAGFTGESLTLGEEDDIANLAAAQYGFNDKARSMKIEWDPIAPTSGSYLLSGPMSDSGWYNEVNVTLSGASDGGGSGIAKVVYRLDADTEWTDYEAPFHLGGGEHTLYFQSIDNVGNMGPIVTATINVDTIAPQTTIEVPINEYGWATSDLIELAATDSMSGVARIMYRLDAGDWKNYTEPFNVSYGQHTVSYKSVDAVGNVEAEKSTSFTLTPMPPLVADFTASPISGAEPLTMKFTDASTGGATSWWSWSWYFGDNGQVKQQSPSHTYAAAGTYAVTLMVTCDDGRFSWQTKSIAVSGASPSPTVTPTQVPSPTPSRTPGAGEADAMITPTPTQTLSPTPATEQTGYSLWGLLLVVLLVSVAGIVVYYYGFLRKS